MTTKSELMAKTQEMSFKFDSVEEKPTPDGKGAYQVILHAPYKGMPDGYSKFASTKMFINGSDMVSAKEMYDWLAKVPKGTVVKLTVAPGKVKENHPDSGEFVDYFWNLVGIPSIAASAAKPPAKAPLPMPQDDSPIFPEDEEGQVAEAPAKRPQQPQGYWDDRDIRISSQWAIDQARAVLMIIRPLAEWGSEDGERDMRVFLADIVNLARRFLAIRDMVAQQGPARKE